MTKKRSSVYIDTAYTLREVREKAHESFFQARHASGFFERVWSVHPIADAVGSPKGSIDFFRFGRNHLVIEGKLELYRLPRVLLPLNFLLSQYRLYKILSRIVRDNDISTIIAVDPYLSGLLGLAVARRTGRKFVLRISGNYDELYEAAGALAMPRLLPNYRLQKLVQRYVISRADLVTAINRNNLAFATANGARGHTAIIPISSNVADVHRIPPEQRESGKPLLEAIGVSTGGPILLYLGRLLRLKHPDDALRAMAKIIREYPATVGILAGTGPMESELKKLASELNVGDSICFAGQLDQPSLCRIIPHCIMLSPSAGQLALLECALGGAPIVAYNRDFQPEFIDDGVDGFIVPFRDHSAMAERAGRLIADPSLALQFSAAIRQKALYHTDPERVKRMEWEALRLITDDEKGSGRGMSETRLGKRRSIKPLEGGHQKRGL